MVLEAVVRWLRHDVERRRPDFTGLLQYVRLHHVSEKCYENILQNELFVQNKGTSMYLCVPVCTGVPLVAVFNCSVCYQLDFETSVLPHSSLYKGATSSCTIVLLRLL